MSTDYAGTCCISRPVEGWGDDNMSTQTGHRRKGYITIIQQLSDSIENIARTVHWMSDSGEASSHCISCHFWAVYHPSCRGPTIHPPSLRIRRSPSAVHSRRMGLHTAKSLRQKDMRGAKSTNNSTAQCTASTRMRRSTSTK